MQECKKRKCGNASAGTQVQKRKCGNARAVGCSAVKKLSPAAPDARRAPKFHLAPKTVQVMSILELTFFAPRQNFEQNGPDLNTPAQEISLGLTKIQKRNI